MSSYKGDSTFSNSIKKLQFGHPEVGKKFDMSFNLIAMYITYQKSDQRELR